MPDPVTDSGLRCPWCDYNLTALTTDTCPECGKRFVLARPGLITAFRHRSFRLSTAQMMVCPHCGQANGAFMPAKCRRCGVRFTWYQRIFGTTP